MENYNRILIVEDDAVLNAGLCYNLQKAGYETVPVYSLKDGKQACLGNKYTLVLLDVNLPDGSGFDFARELRITGNIPILMLTAFDMDEDIMKGFDSGADDYITKPFNVEILIRRVRAILRRQEIKSEMNKGMRPCENMILCGNLEIDIEGYSVKKNGNPLKLTPTEMKLLFKLCQNPGRVLTREILLNEIWDAQGNFVDEHALTVQMSRLKQKVGDREYSYIKTIYGMGYQWIGEKEE